MSPALREFSKFVGRITPSFLIAPPLIWLLVCAQPAPVGDKVAAEIIIAGIHATLTALDIWHRERDRVKAHLAFEQTSQTITPERQAEARQLGMLIPPRVLETIQARMEKCWTHYDEMLAGNDYLPQQLDEAAEQVKKCLCRELVRIQELNGEIPPGTLRRMWQLYCGAKRA